MHVMKIKSAWFVEILRLLILRESAVHNIIASKIRHGLSIADQKSVTKPKFVVFRIQTGALPTFSSN